MRDVVPLWAHQREIAQRAARAAPGEGFGLFLEQGTGKTATAITTLRHRFTDAQRVLRTLVVCPPVVRRNWQREIAKYSTIKREMVVVLDQSGKDRAKLFESEAFDNAFGPLHDMPRGRIFITNYEALAMPELFKLLKVWKPEVLIFDESQRVKDYNSKRTKLAIELADLAELKLLLTGTPILNSALDVWAQFRILDGGRTFDRNFYAFRARYFIDKNAGMPAHKRFPDWRPIPGLEDLFNEKIYKKAARVLKSECLDLPPLVRQRVEVELSPEQERMYRDMREHFIAYLNDKACVANLALTKGLRLQQMLSGFWVDEDGGEHSFKKNPRLDALEELLEDIAPRHKVIVWTSFRPSYKPIQEICDKLKLPWAAIYGGQPEKERQKGIDAFQSDTETRVMIANPGAGGVGVTLTAANYMLYYSRDFKLEHELQSEARCHRGGSEIHDKITRIDIVAPETLDEVIMEALARKENLANNILSLKERL